MDPTAGNPQTSNQGLLSVARWDQAALDFASSAGDGMTASHAHTTEYVGSTFGDGEGELKQRKNITPSVYSFNSGDAQLFTKDVNGR